MMAEKRIKVFTRGYGVVRETELERESETGRLCLLWTYGQGF